MQYVIKYYIDFDIYYMLSITKTLFINFFNFL